MGHSSIMISAGSTKQSPYSGLGACSPAQSTWQGNSGRSGNLLKVWCARQELNLRPTGSKSQPDDSDSPENTTNQDVTQAEE